MSDFNYLDFSGRQFRQYLLEYVCMGQSPAVSIDDYLRSYPDDSRGEVLADEISRILESYPNDDLLLSFLQQLIDTNVDVVTSHREYLLETLAILATL